jgi:penicillin-binding protein A
MARLGVGPASLMAGVVCIALAMDTEAKSRLPSTSTSPVTTETPPTEPVVTAPTPMRTWVQRTADGRVQLRDDQGRWRTMTVEPKFNQTAQRLLAEARPQAGAAVVVEVETGRVLAFTEWPALTNTARSLLLSRELPSASVFKLITTAALVERAHIAPERSVCTEGGEHRLDLEHLLRPTKGIAVCGPFSDILGYSRNAAYAQLVHRHLPPEDLYNYADRLGFNSNVPFELPVRFGHLTPTDDPLTYARTATGFVGSTLSVTGAAYLSYLLANGGRRSRLTLFEPDPEDTSPSSDRGGEARNEQVLEKSTVERLRRMMQVVIDRGTAADAFHDDQGRRLLPGMRIAGKTGTLGTKEGTTSWFVGFAPSRAPRLALAVVLENGALWHRSAKHVAAALFSQGLLTPVARQSAPQKTERLASAVSPGRATTEQGSHQSQ